MSEPGPESIPTSADPRSQRPLKKRALTPVSKHNASIEALFAHPDREVQLPVPARVKELAPPPEIVTNVQGSSAGAGSGEFHVYKASRRREYERIRMMDEENEKEVADREWEAKQKERREKDEGKLNKNRAKRDKAKQRREMGKRGGNVKQEKKGPVVLNKAPAVRFVESKENDNNEQPSVQESVVEEVGIVIHDDD